jgi:hypothetical protein
VSFYQAHIYKNAMELLVTEEIRRQTKQMQASHVQHLNLTEVSAYALNRLPPLYASSQEGLYRQKQRGQQELGQQLQAVVRTAITIASQNPIRLTTPLLPEEELEAEAQLARMALEGFSFDDL